MLIRLLCTTIRRSCILKWIAGNPHRSWLQSITPYGQTGTGTSVEHSWGHWKAQVFEQNIADRLRKPLQDIIMLIRRVKTYWSIFVLSKEYFWQTAKFGNQIFICKTFYNLYLSKPIIVSRMRAVTLSARKNTTITFLFHLSSAVRCSRSFILLSPSARQTECFDTGVR